MGTITFNGASAAQQQAIIGAHDSLSTGLPPAITAARAGTDGFADWFGNADPDQTDAVAAAFRACADSLGQQDFSYDLASPLPILLHPRVFVMFVNVDDSGNVDAQVWANFWPTYYLDPAAGAGELTLGIFHEVAVSFNAEVIDFVGVGDAQAARALAAVDPAAAAHCAANLAGYLAQFVPAGAGRSASHGSRREHKSTATRSER